MSDSYRKDVYIQAIARIFGGLFSFASIIIITYLFDESEIGRYNLVLSTLQIITSLLTLWLSQSILRFFEEGKDESFIIVVTAIVMIVTVIAVLIYGAFQRLSIWAVLYSLVLVIYNVLDAVYRKSRHLIKYALLELLLSIGRFFPMFILVSLIKSYDTIFISQTMVITLYIIILLAKNRRIKFEIKKVNLFEVKRYFKYGIPLVGLSVSTWLLGASAKYIIAYFESDASVGVYSVVGSLSHSIYSMFTLIIVSAFHPIIINKWKENEKKIVPFVSKVIDYNVLLLTPLVFYGCLKSPILLQVFKGDIYASYSSIFVWGAISSAISAMSLLTHKYYELTENTKMIFIYNLISAIVNIILNIILIPLYGFQVAAMVGVVSTVVYYLLVKISTLRVFPVRMSIKTLVVSLSSVVVFYLIDRILQIKQNFISFFIEGIIFVAYTLAIYIITKVLDVSFLFHKKIS